jgi:hypothetical protein
MTFWKSQIQILTEQLARAEARADAAEAALARERAENRTTERHLVSMWLRHNKSLPLPPTSTEKAEAQAKVEEQKKQPIPLTEIEVAMRDANRREAAQYGISEEQADKDFQQRILNRMTTD